MMRVITKEPLNGLMVENMRDIGTMIKEMAMESINFQIKECNIFIQIQRSMALKSKKWIRNL